MVSPLVPHQDPFVLVLRAFRAASDLAKELQKSVLQEQLEEVLEDEQVIFALAVREFEHPADQLLLDFSSESPISVEGTSIFFSLTKVTRPSGLAELVNRAKSSLICRVGVAFVAYHRSSDYRNGSEE